MPVRATSALKLPYHFDEARLVDDLQRLQGSEWMPHFNTKGYEGEWNSISLYAPDGDARNIFAHVDATALAPTPVLAHCPYIQEVVQHFECPLLSVRLLRLTPGSSIAPHRDHALGYEDGCFRLHVPITTNVRVSFVLDGEELSMRPGECWYTNVNYVHSVANRGHADRVHLVLDGARNAWSDALFFALAPRESLLAPTLPPARLSSADQQRMLEELKRQNNPAAKALLQQLVEPES